VRINGIGQAMKDKADRQRPKIAVLLAAYNGRLWLEEQIDSLCQQQEVNVQIFISVDVSTDGSYELCKRYEKTCCNINVLEYGVRYGCAAKNFYRLIETVDLSNFDYVSFADQDDIWFLDKLSHGIKQLRLNNADGYSSNVTAIWGDGRELLIDKAQPQKRFDHLFEAAGPGCTYILSKKSAQLLKGYLKRFPQLNDFIAHDWLAYAIIRNHGFSWFIDPVPKMHYRQHGANQLGVNISLKALLSRVAYVFSGKPFDSIRMLIDVFGLEVVRLFTRQDAFKLALKSRQLRRRKVDQLFVFMALMISAIKGPSN